MKKYEILSIEPSDLPHHWVVSFKFDGGKIEKEAIEALDSYEVFVKFRNQMMKQAKSKSRRVNPKKKWEMVNNDARRT